MFDTPEMIKESMSYDFVLDVSPIADEFRQQWMSRITEMIKFVHSSIDCTIFPTWNDDCKLTFLVSKQQSMQIVQLMKNFKYKYPAF